MHPTPIVPSILVRAVLLGLVFLLCGSIDVRLATAQENANRENSNRSPSNSNIANSNESSPGHGTGSTNGNVSGNATNTNGTQNKDSPTAGVAADPTTTKFAGPWWFYLVVSATFVIVLGPFAWTITRAIRYSRTTYNSPLGLPEGSLRAMLAYTLVAFLGLYVLVSVLTVTEFKPPDFLLGIVATVIGFYFGSRTTGETNAPPQSGGVEGTVKDKSGGPGAGATVELTKPGTKRLTATADAAGAFAFADVRAGDYDIQASLPGHTTSDATHVKVVAGAKQTVSIVLK